MAFKTILSTTLLVLNLMVSNANAQVQPKSIVKATTQTFTMVNSNKELTINASTTLIIKLTENSLTGYALHFQNLDAKEIRAWAVVAPTSIQILQNKESLNIDSHE